MERRVRQSVCAVCNKTVGPGRGTVLNFGAGGWVHTQKCLALAQQSTLSRVGALGDRFGPKRDGGDTNGVSEWTPELSAELELLYQGADGQESFARAVAYEALKEHFTREAERLTKPLNDGSESLDEFIEKLQPEPVQVGGLGLPRAGE